MAACTRFRSSLLLAKATSISWGCGAVGGAGAGEDAVDCTNIGTVGAVWLFRAVKAMLSGDAGLVC